MGKYYILDENGKVATVGDVLTWSKWFEKADRKIARTTIGNVLVSTVFLGIDHAFDGGEPVLFETMVFEGNLDQESERYHSKEDALKGHEEMVQRIKKTTPKKENR